VQTQLLPVIRGGGKRERLKTWLSKGADQVITTFLTFYGTLTLCLDAATSTITTTAAYGRTVTSTTIAPTPTVTRTCKFHFILIRSVVANMIF
jgi:hypothetical protein